MHSILVVKDFTSGRRDAQAAAYHVHAIRQYHPRPSAIDVGWLISYFR